MAHCWRRCIADNKPRSFDAERAMMLTNMVRLQGVGLGAVWPHTPGQRTLCTCPGMGRHLCSGPQQQRVAARHSPHTDVLAAILQGR